jgi:tRNA pseudouridine32 synthase/23S rRNA pseudouridine746 synthase
MDRAVVEIDIVYRDAAIVVVNKPGGLLSVPGRGADKQDCIALRVRNLFPDCIAQPSVHRLDMETSGLMVLALTPEAHRNLSVQFQKRTISKQYLAVLQGIVAGEQGRIELAFRLDVARRPYQVYDPAQGKWGITLWEKIDVRDSETRIRFTPLTGRTHQLRVHAAHPMGLGCPIVGDRLYGHGKPGDRLLLHASFLRLQHPDNNKILSFESHPWF